MPPMGGARLPCLTVSQVRCENAVEAGLRASHFCTPRRCSHYAHLQLIQRITCAIRPIRASGGTPVAETEAGGAGFGSPGGRRAPPSNSGILKELADVTGSRSCHWYRRRRLRVAQSKESAQSRPREVVALVLRAPRFTTVKLWRGEAIVPTAATASLGSVRGAPLLRHPPGAEMLGCAERACQGVCDRVPDGKCGRPCRGTGTARPWPSSHTAPYAARRPDAFRRPR